MTYVEGPTGVSQQPTRHVDIPILSVADLDVPTEAEEATLQRLIDAARARIDMTRGPLLQVVLVHGRSRDRLVVCVHHLAIDGYAGDLLMRDLETAYTAIEAGVPISLPPATTSLRAYGRVLEAYLASPDFQQETDYVQALANRRVRLTPRLFQLPRPAAGSRAAVFPGRVTRRLAHEIARQMRVLYSSPPHVLDSARTRSLLRTCAARSVTPVDLLLYALLRVMHATYGGP